MCSLCMPYTISSLRHISVAFGHIMLAYMLLIGSTLKKNVHVSFLQTQANKSSNRVAFAVFQGWEVAINVGGLSPNILRPLH